MVKTHFYPSNFIQKLQKYSVFTILVVHCYPNWSTVHQFSVSLELVE